MKWKNGLVLTISLNIFFVHPETFETVPILPSKNPTGLSLDIPQHSVQPNSIITLHNLHYQPFPLGLAPISIFNVKKINNEETSVVLGIQEKNQCLYML